MDVGGVGYTLVIPLSTFERLPPAGHEVRLLTTLVVREDAHRLYGFGTETERRFFGLLQDVSGVGPQVALGILSSMPFDAFRTAVLAGDAAQLRRVKGVGKRLSERLVVELKDALAKASPAGGEPGDESERDALLALEALGFTRGAAAKALTKVRGDVPPGDAGELVRAALRIL